MDAQNYSRLLSYLVCEMTMPIKKHVYNFAASDQTSMNPQILSAAALTAKSQIQKKSQKISNLNLTTNKLIDMSGMSIETEHEIPELCQGSVFEEIGLQEMCEGTEEIQEICEGTEEIQEICEGTEEIQEICEGTEDIQELCEGTEIEKSALGDILNYEQNYPCVSTSSNQDNEFVNEGEENNVVNTQSVQKRRCYSKEDEQPEYKKFKDEISDKLSNLTNSEEESALYSDPMLLCSDSDFKVTFKVSRSTFQILVEMLSEEELEPIENVPLHKKVLIVLWLLGTSGSYTDAAQVFDVSEEAVSSCFFDICATLYNKSENFIKWPSSSESDEIASRIEENYGFPEVVGVLGCQYFTISIPKESLSRREHFNGKLRMYCVALQIVCDDEFVIRDIAPGLPGSIRPAQVLRDSPLGELLTTNPAELIDPSKHILASSEFPQLTSMLTPYTKKSESLTKDEEEFNALHGHVSLLVDQTFKMLKDRFHVLKLLDPETATMVLVTTCILHNICIQHGDTYNADEVA